MKAIPISAAEPKHDFIPEFHGASACKRCRRPRAAAVHTPQPNTAPANPITAERELEATLKIDQRFVDRIIARAQKCAMGLGEPKSGYDLNTYADASLESVALLLINSHEEKYDLVSLVWAAMEEVAAIALQELSALRTRAESAEVERDTATEALMRYHQMFAASPGPIPADPATLLTQFSEAKCVCGKPLKEHQESLHYCPMEDSGDVNQCFVFQDSDDLIHALERELTAERTLCSAIEGEKQKLSQMLATERGIACRSVHELIASRDAERAARLKISEESQRLADALNGANIIREALKAERDQLRAELETVRKELSDQQPEQPGQ